MEQQDRSYSLSDLFFKFLKDIDENIDKRIDSRVEEKVTAYMKEHSERGCNFHDILCSNKRDEGTTTSSSPKDNSLISSDHMAGAIPTPSFSHMIRSDQTHASTDWTIYDPKITRSSFERSPNIDSFNGFGDLDVNLTDSDDEREILPKDRTTINGFNVSKLSSKSDSTSSIVKSNLDRAPSNEIQFSPIYNHQSSYEYPNGNVVERIEVLLTDEVYRAKSTGWACITPQSWSGTVRLDQEVAVKQLDGVLRPDTKTFKLLKKRDLLLLSPEKVAKERVEKVEVAQRLCLGVYRCPHCAFSERPRRPRDCKKAAKNVPEPAKSKCFSHKCDLVWHHCTASMVSIFYYTRLRTEVHHIGIHNHEKPPPLRANIIAKRAFDQRVITAPERTPGKLAIGSRLQEPAGLLHEAYHHIGRVARERRKLLNNSRPVSTMASFLELEKALGIEFFGTTSFRAQDGHITLQTRFMRETLAEGQSCLQSDSVHGMIKDPQYGSDIYVSFTSGYCAALERSIPLVVTILFGMSKYHYKHHFLAVFLSFSKPRIPFSQFIEIFPGLTCDFSDAERSGFELALHEHCTFTEGQTPSLEGLYRFCEVHYKRSVTRAIKNQSFVPPARRGHFKDLTYKLLEPQDLESFVCTVKDLLSNFPKVKNWLNWYLNNQRGPLIFPALSNTDYTHLARDTNAQESIGAEFKKLVPVSNIHESIQNIVSILTHYEKRDKLMKLGQKTSYRSPKLPKYLNKRSVGYLNDGRTPTPDAPDIKTYRKQFSKEPNSIDKLLQPVSNQPTLSALPELELLSQSQLETPSLSQREPSPIFQSELLHRPSESTPLSQFEDGPSQDNPTERSYRVGRPAGMPNKKVNLNIDCKTFGIPWGVKRSFFQATNTCPLDTTLMSWFMISRYGDAVLPEELAASAVGIVLQRVMVHIQQEAYDEARFLWCKEALDMSTFQKNGDVYSLFTSTQRVFLDKLSGLFRLVKKEISQCHSPCCPTPIRTKLKKLAQVDISSPGQVTQEAVHGVIMRSSLTEHNDLGFNMEPCDVEMDASVTTSLDEGLWKRTLRGSTDDNNMQEPWICCRGTRQFVSVEMVTLPNILIIANYNGNNDSNCPLPVSSLKVSDQHYHLGVLIYKSATHFRSIVILQDKYLFYDGIKVPKIQFIRPHQIPKMMSSFFITEMWYVKQPSIPPRSPSQERQSIYSDPSLPIPHIHSLSPLSFSPSPLLSSPISSPTSSPKPVSTSLSPPPPMLSPLPSPLLSPSSLLSPTAPTSLSSRGRSFSPEPIYENKPKRSRRVFYPFGFSLHKVATTGSLPVCRGCKNRIDRGRHRIVWKTLDNEAMKYTTTYNFHTDDTCLIKALADSPEDLEAARETMKML